MSMISFVLIVFISVARSTTLGSWKECSDLDQVTSDVATISAQIRSLLVSNGEQVVSSDAIDVISAQCQVVAGMNYHVSINIAAFESVVIGYFIGLPVNGVVPAASKLTLEALGYVAVTDTDALSEVEATVDYMADDIRTLLISEAFEITDSAEIQLVSARSQLNAASTSYKIRVNAAPYHDIMLSYIVPPPILIRGVPQNNPTDLQLVDAGYRTLQDLSEVEAVVQYMDADIRTLLKEKGLNINNASTLKVKSAESRANAGTDYNVSLDVDGYKDVLISYHVPLPLLVHGVPQNNPTDLRLLDRGYADVEDLEEVEAIVEYMTDDIRSLLISNGLEIETDSIIIVTSAGTQKDLGTRYKVTLNIGSYEDVIISYYIGFPFLILGVPQNYPKDLQLIDAGRCRMIVGGYKDISDVTKVKRDIESIADEVRLLLSNEGLTVSSGDDINVISAQSQVVAGSNYRVTICVSSHKDVIVQYFIDLPVNDPQQTPQNLQLVDLGTEEEEENNNNDGLIAGGYSDMDDLTDVKADVSRIQDDIFALFGDEEFSVSQDSDEISVISAQSQVVAGTNYRVTLNIGSHKNVVIQYFIALPVNDPQQMPQNLKLINDGAATTEDDKHLMGDHIVGGYQDVEDLDVVEAHVANIEDDIRSLLNDNGLTVENDDDIKVKSAQAQVVAGTNYKVTLDIGRYVNVVVSYFVDLPVNDEAQQPQNLVLVDAGTDASVSDVESDTTHSVSAHSRVVALMAASIVLGLCVIGFVVGAAVCLTKKTKTSAKGNDLYAELNGDVDNNDAIDVNL